MRQHGDGTCDCDEQRRRQRQRFAPPRLTIVACTPVVGGGVVECASIVDARGFVRNGDDQVEVDESMRFSAARRRRRSWPRTRRCSRSTAPRSLIL